MKNKFIFLFTAMLLLLSGCEKPNPEETQGSEQQEYYGKFQKACVRMNVQNRTDGRKAQVIGDSAAVWKCVRWGTNLHNYNMILDWNTQNGITLTRGDWFDRDTVACVYIFGYECVVRYGRSEPDENGIYNGVPGSEEWGFLMECENMVISGMYDSLHNVYYDPLSDKPWIEVDSSRGWYAGRWRYDTLGYIPNSIVRANRERLIPLFNAGKYSEMMKIMENDYVIYTCTGEEYRELVRQGLN